MQLLWSRSFAVLFHQTVYQKLHARTNFRREPKNLVSKNAKLVNSQQKMPTLRSCLLYTSDAADE